MAIPQYTQIDLNRLQAIIEKFQYAVTDASKTIETFSRKKEDRFQTSLISVLNKKLKNPTVIIQEMQNAGIQDGKRYLDVQRSYDQLLVDQKNAFTNFALALEHLSSKFDPLDAFAQAQSDRNTANALGLTVSDVAFNRYLARYDNISEERADHNLEVVKSVYDKKNDPKALMQDEWVGSLASVTGNEGLIQHLQNAKDFKEFLLFLIQAGAIAKQAKDQNALDHTSNKFSGDTNSVGMMTNGETGVPTTAQKDNSQVSEGTNPQSRATTVLHESQTYGDANIGVTQAHDARVASQNHWNTVQVQGASIRDRGVADQYNAVTTKMINNPGYTAMVAAGLQYAQQVESFIGSMGGAGSSALDLGGALMDLVGNLKKANPYLIAGVGAVAGTVGALGLHQLSGTHDNIRPTPTAKERDDAYKVAVDEINNTRNKSTMDYLKKQGVDVQYNKEMMRFELVKNGKVVGNVGRRLDELSKNVYALTTYGDKVQDLERASGGKVKLNEETGKTALYYHGKFVSNIDLSTWKTGSLIASELEGGMFGSGPLANVKAQAKEEERVRRLNQSAGKSAQTIDDFNNKNNKKAGNKTTTLPSLPTTGEKQPSKEDIKNSQNKNAVVNRNSNLTNTHQNAVVKRTTAHDIQMAKECSRIEKTCNNYNNDIKVIVNPPSGDPIQIAHQVCEQLKRHSCGQSNGMSRESVQNKKTGY